MSDSASTSIIEVLSVGRVCVPAGVAPDPMHRVRGGISCGLQRRAEMLGQAFEVQDPADQVGLLADPSESPPTEAPQPVPILALTEEFLKAKATLPPDS